MKRLMILTLACMLLLGAAHAQTQEPVDYSDKANWAYFGEGAEKAVDAFIIAATVDKGEDGHMNLSLLDEKAVSHILGALNQQRGIFEDECLLYAPNYRQATFATYAPDADKTMAMASLDLAYQDVRDAFVWYMKNKNEGRPIILAGYSQGAELAIRLMKDVFANEAYQQQLVATYAIGWRLTKEDCEGLTQMIPATGETDTGVIVCYSSETEAATGTSMIPEGTWSYSINPLNWKTDSTVADASLNLGACFPDYKGVIKSELPALCGCYIDPVRGALKITGVTTEQYPTRFDDLFGAGSYHLYDCSFFFSNLRKNVTDRCEAYMTLLNQQELAK